MYRLANKKSTPTQLGIANEAMLKANQSGGMCNKELYLH